MHSQSTWMYHHWEHWNVFKTFTEWKCWENCLNKVATLGEKAMAPHSSTLAWQTPWTEEPGRLQSMGSWRVAHDWATSLSLFTFMHWRRQWQPTPVFLPGESQGRGSLVAAVYGVTQSQTQLKGLSSSSSSTGSMCMESRGLFRSKGLSLAGYILMGFFL